jgi:hypothetical protein
MTRGISPHMPVVMSLEIATPSAHLGATIRTQHFGSGREVRYCNDDDDDGDDDVPHLRQDSISSVKLENLCYHISYRVLLEAYEKVNRIPSPREIEQRFAGQRRQVSLTQIQVPVWFMLVTHSGTSGEIDSADRAYWLGRRCLLLICEMARENLRNSRTRRRRRKVAQIFHERISDNPTTRRNDEGQVEARNCRRQEGKWEE